MAQANTHLPDGTIAAAAALRILRERPGAKLVLQAGTYYVTPDGGRIATFRARRLIKKHLSIIDHGLFVGHPQAWACPRSPPIRRYRSFLRAAGKRIARRGRDPVRDQLRAINAILRHANLARIAASETMLDAIVRAHEMTRASDTDARQVLALCAGWITKPPSKRRARTKFNQESERIPDGNASEDETAKGDAHGDQQV